MFYKCCCKVFQYLLRFEYCVTPPLGGRNFWQNQGWQLHREVASLFYITTWLMLFLLVKPLVTAVSAIAESVCHAGEQFSVSVAVIILTVFLATCAVARVKHLVLFCAGNSSCAYSVGSEFCCHSFSV